MARTDEKENGAAGHLNSLFPLNSALGSGSRRWDGRGTRSSTVTRLQSPRTKLLALNCRNLNGCYPKLVTRILPNVMSLPEVVLDKIQGFLLGSVHDFVNITAFPVTTYSLLR